MTKRHDVAATMTMTKMYTVFDLFLEIFLSFGQGLVVASWDLNGGMLVAAVRTYAVCLV